MSLVGLLVSSFLAATLLPGGSELVLVALLHHNPQLYWPALGVATLGNTLGGMSSYLIGWLLPRSTVPTRIQSRLPLVRRHGAPILLLSWVPLIGDLLCVAAGWLRLHWFPSTVFMAMGKFARYWLLAIAIV